jgi:ATP-dependent helicase HrpB
MADVFALRAPVSPRSFWRMNQGDLPIYEVRDAVLAAANKRRFVVTAPTGSGKSTQVPQMLRDGGALGDGQVVVLQPRRLAARLLAARVAQERRVKLGDEVGYQIRFEDVTSARTRIRYVTEGVLLRQMLTVDGLRGVSAILFDEFHERHLYGDITLARALDVQASTRPDLILGVMSATLDVASVSNYLAPCDVVTSEGRTFPVEMEYLTKPVGDAPVWEVAAEEVERLMYSQKEGDALVFMPGAYEIGRTVQAVQGRMGSRVVVLPLHGDLPVGDQDAAVARYDQRKVVVATNVAETSITIDGVRFVVDSGLARIPRYDPYRGINTLLIEKISRASADQRAGRAGRTAPGRCVRLWTQREHEARAAQELPEVKRLDLAEVVLTLKASGVDDVRNFRWLERPEEKALDRAEILLLDLGAVENCGASAPLAQSDDMERRQPERLPYNHRITELGRRMLAFPVHPRYARMLLAAQQFGCVRQAALIAALTQGRELLVRRQGREVSDARDDLFGGETQSDLFVMMRAWRYADRNGYNVDRCRRLGIHAQSARQVGPLLDQFLRIAEREGLDVSEKPVASEAVQKCLLVGFPDHLACRLDVGTLRCALVHGRRGVLARESAVQDAPLLVATEVREVQTGSGKDRDLNVLLSQATAVKEEWLRELFPNDFQESVDVEYDASARRVMGWRRKKFRDLTLEQKTSDEVPLDAAARMLALEVVAGRCVLKGWDESVDQWIVRVNRLREWMPELALPSIAAEDRVALIEQVCHGAVSYKEIKDKPVWPVVKEWLSRQQQQWVDEFAPERVALPNGKRAKVSYTMEGPPTVGAFIKDLYEVKEGLWIANRRVALTIQILAPNHRPIQVTQNLGTFWREMYPKVKQELMRKYPRHEWR